MSFSLRSSEYNARNAQYHMFNWLKIVYMPLWFVHNGLDNPLFLALQRIIRRRLKIESLMQFILELYLLSLKWKTDFFIFTFSVRIKLRHKTCKGVGVKATTYAKTIWMDLANAELISGTNFRNQDGNFTGVVHLEGYKTTVLKLTWLLEISKLVGFDYLITKKK
ncbi:hypothetical protein CISIN_1g035795mg, partial [Citrus sinensis]